MKNYLDLSLEDRRDIIWQNRSELKGNLPTPFRASKELKEMSEEDVNALLSLLPEPSSDAGDVSDDTVNAVTGLTPRIAKDGSAYTTAELELIEISQSGTNFSFDYKGCIVSVSQDSQLILAHRQNPLQVGAKFHFNVASGIAPFVKNGSRWFANSSVDYPSNGRLNKSLHPEIFESILEKRQEQKALQKVAIVEIAMDTNQSIGKINKMFREEQESNAKARVQDLIKSLQGK